MKITKTGQELARIILDKAARNYAQQELNEILYLHRFKKLRGEISVEEQGEYDRAQRDHRTLGDEYINLLVAAIAEDCDDAEWRDVRQSEAKHAIETEAEMKHGAVIKDFRRDPDTGIQDEIWYMMGKEYEYD